ncbi:MAG TPA: hypothetical protein ENI80_03545 [Acidiferrobacteraceae bacterium]|nr:hypothetical protein [Acidiferrobacteraceae bacterium]
MAKFLFNVYSKRTYAPLGNGGEIVDVEFVSFPENPDEGSASARINIAMYKKVADQFDLGQDYNFIIEPVK